MSIAVMNLVDESNLKPGLRWTLHQMANRVNDEGRGYFEAVDTLAHKTGHEPRTVQRHLAYFRQHGLIVLVREPEQRRPAEYRLDVEAIAALPKAERKARKPKESPAENRGDKMSPLSPRGDKSAIQGRQNEHPGATNLQSWGDMMSPNSTTDSTTDPTTDSHDAPTPGGVAAAPVTAGRFEGDGDVVQEIPLATKADPVFRVRASLAASYAAEFTALNIPAELLACWRWNNDHPSKRKTREGMLKHLTAWMKNAQNNPRQRAKPKAEGPGAPEAHKPPACDKGHGALKHMRWGRNLATWVCPTCEPDRYARILAAQAAQAGPQAEAAEGAGPVHQDRHGGLRP